MIKPSVLLAQALSYLAYYCPPVLRRSFAWGVGILWFDVLRIRRKLVLKNIERVFPDMSEAERVAVGRHSLYQMGLSLVEFLIIPRLSENWIDNNVEFVGFEKVEAARAKGKGVLFLSMHLGSVDLGATVTAMDQLPIHLISKKFKSQWANDFWFFVRSQMGVKFIDPHGVSSSFEILKALKKNEAVIFVLDQFMGPPFGIPTQFFGVRTGTSYGLALFAMKTRAPIFLVYTVSTPEGKTRVVVEDEIPFVEKGSRDDTVHYMTNSFNRVIEETIRKYPEQWMWIHNRWKPYNRNHHSKELFFDRKVD